MGPRRLFCYQVTRRKPQGINHTKINIGFYRYLQGFYRLLQGFIGLYSIVYTSLDKMILKS